MLPLMDAFATSVRNVTLDPTFSNTTTTESELETDRATKSVSTRGASLSTEPEIARQYWSRESPSDSYPVSMANGSMSNAPTIAPRNSAVAESAVIAQNHTANSSTILLRSVDEKSPNTLQKDVAQMRWNTMQELWKQNKYEEVIPHLLRILDHHKVIWVIRSQSVNTILNIRKLPTNSLAILLRLAASLLAVYKWDDEAVGYLRCLMEVQEIEIRHNAAFILALGTHRANLWRKQYRRQRGVKIYESYEDTTIDENGHTNTHTRTRPCRRDQNSYEEAKSSCLKSIKLREEHLGRTDTQTLDAIWLMAELCRISGDSDETFWVDMLKEAGRQPQPVKVTRSMFFGRVKNVELPFKLDMRF